MRARHFNESIDQAPVEILHTLLNYMDLSACINFLLTTKELFKILESENVISILCFANIIKAIGAENNPEMTKEIISSIITKEIKPEGIFKENPMISLFFANYCHPYTEENHIVFSKPNPLLPRSFYLTEKMAEKKIGNYSSVQSFSLFKLPLKKINWRSLCEKQCINYEEKLDPQGVHYMRIN